MMSNNISEEESIRYLKKRNKKQPERKKIVFDSKKGNMKSFDGKNRKLIGIDASTSPK